jgi:MoxR-like ATPase
MEVNINLSIGDTSKDGNTKIIDEDRLCYLVENTNKSAYGLRTISKNLLIEFIEYLKSHPDTTAQQARNALCGNSKIDKFEYGYFSTLLVMAKMALFDNKNLDEKLQRSVHNENKALYPLQTIYFGAPGGGKSTKVKNEVIGNNPNFIRTTFHPDTDYASFVGCYKPQTDGNGHISYEFVPQAFAKAYVNAWKLYLDEENENIIYYLVIEEINRGNCAQIFGDIFQLLDRKDNGFSDYPIDVDSDFANFLARVFDESKKGISEKEIGICKKYKEIVGEISKITLPPNLHIVATMNTSDQSLYPMDSAFKRRWEWEYVPIDYGEAKDIKIVLDDSHKYSWEEFLLEMNGHILEDLSSADKQMGVWFVKAKNNTISLDQFRSKVMFYLINDVYRDLPNIATLMGKNDEKQYYFEDLYKETWLGDLEIFFRNLSVTDISNSFYADDDVEKDNSSEVKTLHEFFWKGFREQLLLSGVINTSFTIGTRGVQQITSLGFSGVSLVGYHNTQTKKLNVKVWIASNKDIYQYLLVQKDKIDIQQLTWKDTEKAQSISLESPVFEVNSKESIKWLVENVEKLYVTFKPLVDEYTKRQ